MHLSCRFQGFTNLSNLEPIAGKVINEQLQSHAWSKSKLSFPQDTDLVVNQFDSKHIRQKQDNLVLGVVYGGGADVAFNIADDLDLA
jgi:hypothetical protein